MRGRDFELPAEALRMIEQVRQLEARADEVRSSLGADLADIRNAASKERADVEAERAELAHDREALEALLESRVHGFEFIADAWADYERANAKAEASALQHKSHPARSSASVVRAKGKQMAELRRELKRAEWVLRLYEWHFPWLAELRDFEEERCVPWRSSVPACRDRADDPWGNCRKP